MLSWTEVVTFRCIFACVDTLLRPIVTGLLCYGLVMCGNFCVYISHHMHSQQNHYFLFECCQLIRVSLMKTGAHFLQHPFPLKKKGKKKASISYCVLLGCYGSVTSSSKASTFTITPSGRVGNSKVPGMQVVLPMSFLYYYIVCGRAWVHFYNCVLLQRVLWDYVSVYFKQGCLSNGKCLDYSSSLSALAALVSSYSQHTSLRED